MRRTKEINIHIWIEYLFTVSNFALKCIFGVRTNHEFHFFRCLGRKSFHEINFDIFCVCSLGFRSSWKQCQPCQDTMPCNIRICEQTKQINNTYWTFIPFKPIKLNLFKQLPHISPLLFVLAFVPMLRNPIHTQIKIHIHQMLVNKWFDVGSRQCSAKTLARITKWKNW